MKIVPVVPAHQAESTLRACLEGLAEAGFLPAEITVVDDGSRDATARIARDFGASVVTNPSPLRPAKARNRGVDAVDADVVFFVDADVVLTSHARRQLETHFSDPSVDAVIGSYNAFADGGSIISDYRNLLHHLVHQKAGGPSPTFWTGIGAVRRDAFRRVGGLLSEWENIEDVEFGLRLNERGGRIILDPALQGTHLKIWTPGSMFRTDLDGRAVPWTRLLLEGRAELGRLNTTPEHLAASAGVGGALLTLPLALAWPPAIGLSVASAAVFGLASIPVAADLVRLRGWTFALRSLPWHALHYVAGMTGYAKARWQHLRRK